MVVKVLSSSDVRTRAAVFLGLAGGDDLLSQEGLSALLRRTAGSLCPCPARALVRVIYDALHGFVAEPNSGQRLRNALEDTVESLTAYGDLIEVPADGGQNGTLLAAAPPRFVGRQSGAVYIMGIAPDNVSFLPPEIESCVERRGHVRRLTPANGENLIAALKRAGLAHWSEREWLYAPPRQPAAQVLSQLEARLRGSGIAGEINDLEILDPSMPPDFYIKRWRRADRQTGFFVAKRPKTYGSPLWCYVELKDGKPQHLIDFPAANSRWRGCDEAWHLQMAIDAKRGTPQVFRLRTEQSGSRDILVYSPIPMWAQRRWDTIGERIEAKGCLIAFRFPANEIEEESRFANSLLWLESVQDHT